MLLVYITNLLADLFMCILVTGLKCQMLAISVVKFLTLCLVSQYRHNIPFANRAVQNRFFKLYTTKHTPYNYWNTFLEVMSDLQKRIENLFDWFCYNKFKANASILLAFITFKLKSYHLKFLP